ncbi:hypothetical protein PMN64_06840 [Bradyrhizobium sp. UFLA01-814]|uniref:hypothetical protein n=1 Tax=Bradyrhizobium sp. UFLA01-814 TaxID=3023480 RepID=UPI00398A9645
MSDGPIVAHREVDTVDVAQPCTRWFVVVISHPFEKGGTQPNLTGADQRQKRPVVFLEGTSVDSNAIVRRMRAFCAAKSANGKPQLVYYSVGANGF